MPYWRVDSETGRMCSLGKRTASELRHGGRNETERQGTESVMVAPHSSQLAVSMKAELQELMNRLRKLQGAIDFGDAPMAEREELAGSVTDIMDALFEVMKTLPDE